MEERRELLELYLIDLVRITEACSHPQVLQFLGAMEVTSEEKLPEVQARMYFEQYLNVAQTGDIVLFHTEGVLQSVNRFVSSSDYDHVAVVVKDPPLSKSNNARHLFLLESTIDGVIKYRLRTRFLAWNMSNAELVVRRLNCERSKESLISIVSLMHELDGKKYGLNPLEMVRGRSDSQMTKDSYFCSEIVAMAYKRAGWLPEDIPSNKYFPWSFDKEHSHTLQFLKGASLGEETLIQFKRPEIESAYQMRPVSSSSSDEEDYSY